MFMKGSRVVFLIGGQQFYTKNGLIKEEIRVLKKAAKVFQRVAIGPCWDVDQVNQKNLKPFSLK